MAIILLICSGAASGSEIPATEELAAAYPEWPSFMFPADLGQIEFVLPLQRQLTRSEAESYWALYQTHPPADTMAWESLAAHFFAESQFARVVEIQLAAYQAGQFNSTILYRLTAMAHEAQNDWTAARAAWQMVFQLDATDPLPLRRIALSWLHAGDGDQALDVLNRQLRRHPDDLIAHHLQAALYWHQGDIRAAGRTLARATAVGRTLSTDILLMLAWVALQEDAPYEAVGWLGRALEPVTPQERGEWLTTPYFGELRDHALLVDWLENYAVEWPTAPVRVAPKAMSPASPAEPKVITEWVDVDRHALPDALRVSMQLQAGLGGQAPLIPPEQAASDDPLRLRPTPSGQTERDIEWGTPLPANEDTP